MHKLKKIYIINNGDQEMENKKIIGKITEVIDKVKPYLEADGGSINFNKYENGVVYVSLKGSCSGCPMASITLKEMIENVLTSEIPEIIKVVNED